MKVEGLKLISKFISEDTRGGFHKPYSLAFEEFKQTKFIPVENFISISNKNTLRGMHLQVGEYAHNKLVSIIQGSVLDVIVDLRKLSSTYGNFQVIEIDEKSDFSILIPIGCAHGFLTLDDNTIMSYLVDTVYNKNSDTGIKYDSFGYDWPIKSNDIVISQRDLNLPLFKNFNYS